VFVYLLSRCALAAEVTPLETTKAIDVVMSSEAAVMNRNEDKTSSNWCVSGPVIGCGILVMFTIVEMLLCL